ncbi:Os05g0578750 [Oryza sativa Japonica Group]|uniref:Os05g0578750 protein n=1 Tax=Oryza sativa subsp. japonica TaxID=39947 RepID=A0A0P0WR85_ORYSJ|nr:hypothetical protein EE612_031321 [Oryza sativa]BAS95500.1 Os05g0578750 [Oryza sativa Japonica Group]
MLTCQVLILTPVIVLNMLTSLTVTLDTHAFVLYLPRPPMLIPCPGPQFTLCMFMSLQPVWMETQSSPASQRANITSDTCTSVFSFPLLMRALPQARLEW